MLQLLCIYCGLVFCAVVGVLQAAAARNNLKGLLFFRKKASAYLFAGLAGGFSLFVFFIWNYRYAVGVIEGSQQAGFFALSAGIAVVFTLITSAIIKDSSVREDASVRGRGPVRIGLDFFRKATYFAVIRKLAHKNP